MILDFATKKKRRKGKRKNCKKGYPCGYGCIEKTRNCSAKLKEQSSTYAGWLKKQAKKLEVSGTKNTKDTRKKPNKTVDKVTTKTKSKQTTQDLETLQALNKEGVSLPKELIEKDKAKAIALGKKLQEFEKKGIEAFSILDISSDKMGDVIIAMKPDGRGAVYQAKPEYNKETFRQEYTYAPSTYLSKQGFKSTVIPYSTTSRFIPKTVNDPEIAFNKKMRTAIENRAKAKITEKEAERAERVRKEKEAERVSFLQAKEYDKHLTQKIKALIPKKGKGRLAQLGGKATPDNPNYKEVEATFYGKNKEFFTHRENKNKILSLTHAPSGLQILSPKTAQDAKKAIAALTEGGFNWKTKTPTKEMAKQVAEISTFLTYKNKAPSYSIKPKQDKDKPKQDKEYDRFTKKPGESIREFLDRRDKDPEVIKQQMERDRQAFKNTMGILPDRPIGEIGSSGLGGRKRRSKKKKRN